MKKLLIVIDMQNDFIDGALGTEEAIKILPRVIDKIKSHNGEIIYTRDTHSEEYLDTQEGKKLPISHCIKGSEGWELANDIGELAKASESKIFDKPTFGSLELANYVSNLYKKGQIQEIELVGLCTDICVISNAMILKAAMPEVSIVVDGGCCAGVTPESHDNALKSMNMCQIQVI